MSYYGDDFTGSTDALEVLTRAGARTMLFIAPPTAAQLAAYNGLQAFGVAGVTRSLNPAEMEAVLAPAFEQLKAARPKHVHYKVCSTFDSSPETGSIGRAMETGAAVFPGSYIPLLVAAPALGRYCTFGNLFARMGIGSGGGIYRLDRHPSMKVHPVTPATESDLRLHLAKQTERSTGLLDILQIESAEPEKHLAQLISDGYENILFDGLYEHQLAITGRLIDNSAVPDTPLFSAGSSGIEMALCAHWNATGILQPRTNWPKPATGEPVLVISGSCSPVSAAQIAWAEAAGFAGIALDTAAIAANPENNNAVEQAVTLAAAALQQNQSVIIHTSSSNTDARIKESNDIFKAQGYHDTEIRLLAATLFGTALGNAAKAILAQTNTQRIVVAGGDTSGYAAKAMGIEALEMLAPLTPGAPICTAYAPGSPLHLKEIIFKGGQVGAEDYYNLKI